MTTNTVVDMVSLKAVGGVALDVLEMTREVLTSHGVAWQGVVLHTTGKGRTKVCVSGLPGKLWWKHWKAAGGQLKLLCRLCGFWLVKVGPGQWELLLGVNRRNRCVIAECLGLSMEQLAESSQVVDAAEVSPGVVVESEGENPY